jgi:hypothetical protein
MRRKLPEVISESQFSRESEDADRNLRKGAEGGVCAEGMRGDESLVSTLRTSKPERKHKNSPAAIAET